MCVCVCVCLLDRGLTFANRRSLDSTGCLLEFVGGDLGAPGGRRFIGFRVRVRRSGGPLTRDHFSFADISPLTRKQLRNECLTHDSHTTQT